MPRTNRVQEYIMINMSHIHRAALGCLLLGLTACGDSCGDGKTDKNPQDMSSVKMDMSDAGVDMGPQRCTTSEDCTGAAAGLSCVGDVCVDCERGALECACFANGRCEANALCEGDVCVPCTPGVEGCPCNADDTCNDGLTCDASVCVPDTCSPGDLDCPCDGSSCNGINDYCDEMGVCRVCSSDIAGCACDADGTCQGMNFCDEQDTCQSCPDTDRPASCVCQETADCDTGLVCDADESVCREKQACADLCLPNQECDASGAGDPICVPNSCIAGFMWDGTMCVAVGGETCDGRGGTTDKSLECDMLSKDCVELGSMVAVCVDTCATIGPTLCSMQNRDCEEGPRDQDAVCGACQPGYADDGAGNCLRDPTANCAPLGTLGSIAEECDMRNQLCVPDAVSGALCGDCINEGFTFDASSNRCVEAIRCGGEVCSMDEYCSYPQMGGPPRCETVPGNCSDTEAYDEAMGTCVACAQMCDDQGAHPVTLNGECVCARDLYCAYQYDGAGDRCVQPSDTCQPGEALTPQNQCISCNITCGDEGERNRTWPYTTVDGSCICETQEGYYLPFGGASQPLECDADGDGWINRTAYETYTVAAMQQDTAVLANFRCEFRQIDRFTLLNEWGQRRHVSLCENDLVDYAPGAPSGCAADLTRLTLYESDKLDDDDSITLDDTNFPLYGSRKLAANEVNALTKACVSANADFNLNGVEDLREEHAIERNRINGLTFTDDESFMFHSMAFFTELHQGHYVPPANAALAGEYVIAERSRCADEFPVQYSATGSYWKNCERSRRGDWDGSNTSFNGFDFAKWGCSQKFDGTCDLATPAGTGQDLDGDRVEDHGLCDQTAALPNEPWRGMNHHSQFQCAIMKDSNVSENYELLRSTSLFEDGNVNSGFYEFNECTANDCTAGMMGCEETTSQGVLQPRTTQLTCLTRALPDVMGGQVGWVAVRYTPEGSTPSFTRPYLRGCVDESYGTNAIDHYSTLCPGYNENPDAVLTAGNPGDSGKLICACNRFYAGERCEFSCAEQTGSPGSSFLHVGGGRGMTSLYDILTPQQRADFGCGNDGYCSLVPKEAAEIIRPGFPGGRYGFWVCGDTGLTRTLDINGQDTSELVQNPTMPGTGFSIQGKVKSTPINRGDGLESAPDTCKPLQPGDPIVPGYCIK